MQNYNIDIFSSTRIGNDGGLKLLMPHLPTCSLYSVEMSKEVSREVGMTMTSMLTHHSPSTQLTVYN